MALKIETINNAVYRGIYFVKQSLSPEGFWHTFQSSQGESDVWVSAYIIREIGSLLCNEEIACRVGKALLNARASDGGWGYKQNYISDSDSTATVCLGLCQLDQEFLSEQVRAEALNLLVNHLHTWNTGFRTFQFQTLTKVFEIDTQSQVLGWIEPHFDVSTNVCEAIAKIGGEEIRYLCEQFFYTSLKTNSEKTFEEAYWWSTDFLCTYYMIKLSQTLLLSKDVAVLDKQVKKIAESMSEQNYWHSQFSREPCAFTSSIALRCLAWNFDSYKEQIVKAVNLLITLQKDDGSWDSQPILVIPTPQALSKRDISDWKIDIPGSPNVLSDNNRVLVTSVAVRTLYDIKKLLQHCDEK